MPCSDGGPRDEKRETRAQLRSKAGFEPDPDLPWEVVKMIIVGLNPRRHGWQTIAAFRTQEQAQLCLAMLEVKVGCTLEVKRCPC